MRILFLTASLEAGGAERQLSVLARGLYARGHDVTVLTFYDRGILRAELEAAGVTVHTLGKSSRWDLGSLLPKLVRTVRAMRPDIVHSYLTTPNLAAAITRPFLATRALVWGIRYADMDIDAYDRVTRLTYRIQPQLARCADLVIANSEAGRAMALREGFPADRLAVVTNGIDTERFKPGDNDREATRRDWGFDPDERVIGIAARLDPMKDHATFLRAAAILAAADPRLRFVCIGNDAAGMRPRLDALAHELGLDERIVWTGAVTDMPAAYRALDLCVLSSAFGEGFPNVVAEAMACGLRCAVTDVGDAATIVGDTGRVVAVRDPEALAKACRSVLDREGGPDPRAHIIERFEVARMVERSEQLLLETIGEPPCAA